MTMLAVDICLDAELDGFTDAVLTGDAWELGSLDGGALADLSASA